MKIMPSGDGRSSKITPQMIQSYEIDQSCVTDENWANPFGGVSDNQEEDARGLNGPVKVVQSSYRPHSRVSSENENVHIDSMISFECRPVI